MKPPAYFARAAGLRSTMPYLVPPRAHGRVPAAAEMASLAPPDGERPQAGAAPRPAVANAPAAATAVTSSGARRTAVRQASSAPAAHEPVTPEVAHEVVTEQASTPDSRPAVAAAPAAAIAAPDPQALPRRAAARSIVAAEAPATTRRRAVDAVERETVDPAVPWMPSSEQSPRPEGEPVVEMRPPMTAAARRAPKAAFEAAVQSTDDEPRPRREHAAAVREPVPPPLDLPAPRPRPAPALPPSPRTSGSSGEVRIGTLEVRVVPPAAEPQQPAIVMAAPAAPSAPLARGFASSIGIRQA